MPVDARIPLGVQLPQVNSPLEAVEGMARISAIRQAQQQSQRKAMAQMRIQQLAQQHPNDPDAFVEALGAEFPEEAVAFGENLWKMRKEGAQAHKAQTEAAQAQLHAGLELLQGSDAKTYGPRVQMILRMAPELEQILPTTYDPAKLQGLFQVGQKTSEFLKAQQDAADKLVQKDTRGSVLTMFAGASNQAMWDVATDLTKQAGLGQLLGLVPDAYSPEAQAQVAQASISPDKQAELNAKAPTGAAGSDYGRFLARVAAEKGKAPETLSVAEELAAKKAYGQADDRPPRVSVSVAGGGGGQGDAKAIAQAIIDGDQPPELTGLYRFAAPVRAELARKGYNLTTASEDWKATQKYLNTLNGAQQTRLRQAITFTHDSLDVIDDLNSKWKGGRFPILNRAQLRLAKNGALGSEAQTIATQLDAQISDLVSELGTVYKGGNSSTDESLKLAAQNLQSDWSQKQLADAVQLARKNLTIRANSMRNVGAVANAGNPYAPKQPEQAAPSGDGKRFQILSVK